MISKDPSNRPTATEVLSNPFLGQMTKVSKSSENLYHSKQQFHHGNF